ncbi:MAG: dihydroorotate dehydrogenase electron transfer subunit [Bacteroidales bacterium]|nr:dihydroorotate dehydrogenase electron transfer subunit [Bacteroidales bacterium]
MKEVTFTILENVPIAPRTFRMKMAGDTSAIRCSGEFVDFAIDGKFLRRPISVHDCDWETLTIVYKVVGEGTAAMAAMLPGDKIKALTGLGNSFDIDACRSKALLLGGGVGAAPLYLLAKELTAQGKEVTVVLGFNKAEEVMLVSEFENLCAKVFVATMDGSAGTKGFVTDVLRIKNLSYDYFYACGPKPMLKAVCESVKGHGDISLEERMGCGAGFCYCCSIETVNGPRRVCKDGPVFKKEELVW